ncbi:MAG TPA: class I SAM-dependent methyltransferase [Bryobacteraceae bacterium]|nr:class I SAM-dependent methyltransferase [Bryobacteraceae bacterium]HOL72912.1 class I SAM-dependent methyltransferase [Bryobacteraceae bacterium]HOQ44949.1 class I SAM-dependent methyltransferase [Bryobacteraceae bacterium]HPQ16380.1 class I SAM-dependent methyltransferase [Bryobacteraceae bacterium]HPU72041.1 class I SAM-dependent methyltransferase [Bryobacteraceae bacterium]
MNDADVVARMRRDWDARAAENAKYYVACQKCEQSDAEFYSGAPEIIARVRRDYVFLPQPAPECRFLEIGCGLGRLMFSLAADCREIHGVDISPEMIAIARDKLRDIPNARFTVAENSDLSAYPDSYFDLAYSYAVFQHIPDRAVIFRYLDETLRVLRPGGVFIGHFNGAPPAESRCDTWVGCWVSSDELFKYARDRGWQVLCREGADSPYLWLTMKKPAASTPLRGPVSARIITVAAADGGRTLVAGGPMGFATLYATGIPAECCCLTRLSASIGSTPVPPCYLGPASADQPRQINIQVLEETPAGEHDLVLLFDGRPVSEPVRVSVKPRPPVAPRLVAVTDGKNILTRNVITSGIMQLNLEECRDIGSLEIAIAGRPVAHSPAFCVNPLSRYYHVNVPAPEGIFGKQTLQVSVDGQQLAPVEIEIVPPGS